VSTAVAPEGEEGTRPTADLQMTVTLLQDVALCIPGLQIIFFKDDDSPSNFVAVDVALQAREEGGHFHGKMPLPFRTADFFAVYWHDSDRFEILEPKEESEREQFQTDMYTRAMTLCHRERAFENEILEFSAFKLCKGECKKMVNPLVLSNTGVCVDCVVNSRRMMTQACVTLKNSLILRTAATAATRVLQIM
jgi:hypothetical protein